MYNVAQLLKETTNREERIKIINRYSKRDLERLCKLLGLRHTGNIAEIRSRLIHMK